MDAFNSAVVAPPGEVQYTVCQGAKSFGSRCQTHPVRTT